jgi:hypothetical protein
MLARSSLGRLSTVVTTEDLVAVVAIASDAGSRFVGSSETVCATVPELDFDVKFTIDSPDACAVSDDILAAVVMYIGVETGA